MVGWEPETYDKKCEGITTQKISAKFTIITITMYQWSVLIFVVKCTTKMFFLIFTESMEKLFFL